MSLVPAPIQDDTEVRAITKHVSDTVSLARSAVVETAEHVEWATAVLGELARHQKSAEDLRLRFTRPLNESLRALNEFFKGLMAPLALADRMLRGKVLAYRETERQRLADERARLAADAAVKEAEARALLHKASPAPQAEMKAALNAADAAAEAVVLAPAPSAPTVKTALGSTTARRVMDFEVTDLYQVPRAFLVLDRSRVLTAIRGGTREIQGLRIYEKEILAVRPQ